MRKILNKACVSTAYPLLVTWQGHLERNLSADHNNRQSNSCPIKSILSDKNVCRCTFLCKYKGKKANM